MFSVIVFSKNRPLQLEGFVRSLLANCKGLSQNSITGLIAMTEDYSYTALNKAFPDVKLVSERSFQSDLEGLLDKGTEYVLIGCDDVFFTRAIDAAEIIDALATDPELFCVSLRLGRNIRPMPVHFESYGPFLRYDWRACGVHQWSYPFDVSASVYRRNDLLRILHDFGDLHSPNFLESNVSKAIEQGHYKIKPALACYPLSRSLTLTINRVQETHSNPFDGGKSLSPEELQTAFEASTILDTERYAGAVNHVIHTDARYFGLCQAATSLDRVPTSDLVSVICFTYNRSQYLPKMIASVLGQDYTNIELLVYDDCSTEDMQAVVAPFLGDKRLRYLKGDHNLGGTGAFDLLCDTCLSLTKGEFVCFVGDDDMFMPHKTSSQLAYFAEHPDVDVVFCDAHFIDAQGKMIKGEFRNPVALNFSDTNLLRFLLHNNSFAQPCVMMRRASIDLAGGFACGKVGFCADYHMWGKISPFLNIAFQDEKMVFYRIHGNNVSIGSQICHQSTLACKLELFNRFTIYDFFPELYATNQDAASLGSAYLELGNLLLSAPIPYPALAAHCYTVATSHSGSLIAQANGLLALALDGRGQEVRIKAPQVLNAASGLPKAQAEAVRTQVGQALSAARGKLDSLSKVHLLREVLPNHWTGDRRY